MSKLDLWLDGADNEKLCIDAAMHQWERSLKRPDLREKDRVRGAIDGRGETMNMLDIGYLIGVIPCALAAVCLPLVWWRPAWFGPPLFYLIMLGFVASSILMSGALG
jgi:hypothetical protein